MDAYFFDTSALVKRYAGETGSAWVKSIADGNYIFIARITFVEFISAIEKQRRSTPPSFTEENASRALKAFSLDFENDYSKINISNDLIYAAGRLIRKHTLRAYDAVQLAAAIEVQQLRTASNLSGLTLVSADKELNAAAEAEGLIVEDPNDHR